MAIILNQPNGGEFFYAYRHSTEAMNCIYNKIMFDLDSGADTTVDIAYSLDSGSTWTNIETSIPLSAMTAYMETNDYVYYWKLTTTEYAAIFNGVNEVDTFQIKVTGDVSGATASATDATIRKVITYNIIPNSDNNGNAIVVTSNGAQINILWEELYTSTLGGTVKIEYRAATTSGGTYSTWETLVAAATNNGHYTYSAAAGGDFYTLATTNPYFQLRISSNSTGHQNILDNSTDTWYDDSAGDVRSFTKVCATGNTGYSEFHTDAITDFKVAVTYSDGDAVNPQYDIDKHHSRIELFKRTAIEKAALLDEAVALGQLEAGANIVIEQRDKDGLIDGDNAWGTTTNSPFGAFNVVIRTENIRDEDDLPRHLQGVLDFTGNSVTLVRANNLGGVLGVFYSVVVSLPITHNWDLGNNTGARVNQTANSFHLEIVQIDATAGDVNVENNIVPQWENDGANGILVYCGLKGNSTKFADSIVSTGSPDDLVSLSKDELEFDPGSYIFEWRLTEIIPE